MMGVSTVLWLAVPLATAWAGGDDTFQTIADQLTAWMQGSLGTALSLFGGILGVGSAIRGDWAGLGTGIGVAAGAYYLPTVVGKIVTGTM